ncbi:helix-turn-helix domain-containing protein [Acetobacter sicerae]|uniref:Helix-turn-helix domain-containing protein n=1 Tax=Acetobacter sicerae TaxID=85325 RepID=A0ABS8VXU5_9PROT|nr:helix-turn-helix domain-containing protein [Acetobacter sicerae]MCE0743737.1 helix-turn-helix domain-containing protein [Acetobacter sicerae]
MHDIQIPDPLGRFITRLEAARIYLRCHVATVDRYVAEGLLPKCKFGRKTLFLVADVLKLVIRADVPDMVSGAPSGSTRRGRACSQLLPAALETLIFFAIAIALLTIFIMLHH